MTLKDDNRDIFLSSSGVSTGPGLYVLESEAGEEVDIRSSEDSATIRSVERRLEIKFLVKSNL